MSMNPYFGVNYNSHYQCAQSQYQQSCCGSGYNQSVSSYGCETGYGCGQSCPTTSYGQDSQSFHPFMLLMQLMRRMLNHTEPYHPPKQYYSEGPRKYAVMTEGPRKLVAKESTSEGPRKRVMKSEAVAEGPRSWTVPGVYFMPQLLPADAFAD